MEHTHTHTYIYIFISLFRKEISFPRNNVFMFYLETRNQPRKIRRSNGNLWHIDGPTPKNF